ncbi:MAG: beta-ketoacyl synthase N-terminal-like domain-containing protein [Acidobacteriota bacterium]
MKQTDSFDGCEAVAVIGMAGRFPGAGSVDEFWRNLSAGEEAVSFFSTEDLERAQVGREVYSDPAYVRAKGALEGVELFDAAFFGLTPREAEIMDPQQRLFLECAWEALENAGYDFAERGGRVGVYAGASLSTYLLFNLLSNPAVIEAAGGLQVRMANDKDFLTTLVSYKLNLKGPSVAVQTACSTSLVAVHLACQGLLDGECDLAMAGGVAVSFPHRSGYQYVEGGIWSPDGHCRAFDADAQGTIEGNGAGVVVLKRLADARADRDFIHAVIRGSAVNNDGALKAGYTAPSVESQTQVVLEALSMAGVSADSITYIEAHGSATPLGDPIEVQALTKAFRASTAAKNFCALGSVKSNLGHLDNAAGIASFIKTVEALKHKVIPPTLHFREPNPRMDLPHSPFYVNTSATEWRSQNAPRRAGINSLGIGGTNAHIVLEEAPEQSPNEDGAARSYQLLLLSAKTGTALEAATARLASHLKQHPELPFADVAYTLQAGRRAFNQRRVLVSQTATDAATALENPDARLVFTGSCEAAVREVAFMFPGLGDHYAGMAADLYREEPIFREHVDYCAAALKPHLGLDLRDVLYPPMTGGAPKQNGSSALRKLLAREEPEDEAARRLNQTFIAQPAVFVIEYALAQLLMEWGIRPQAMIGYSIGEYVAACLAGVFSLDDALLLVAERARMIDELPGGAMLAVPLAEEELPPLPDAGLSLCASNGPALSVVGGTPEAVEVLERQLAAQGVACRRLRTSHAFHSQMMEPILDRFKQRAGRVRLSPPQVPFISNVTGTWITDAEATDPAYWATHARQTVRFNEGLRELLGVPGRLILEVGPGQSLGTLVRQHTAKLTGQVVLPTLRDRRDEVSDVALLLTTLGRAWLAGATANWPGFHAHERRGRVPLPAYPFERQRYWVEPGTSKFGQATREKQTGNKADLADWFYIPVWKRARPLIPPPHGESAGDGTRWLVFLDDAGLGSLVAQRLTEQGREVISVKIGARFASDGSDGYTLNPGQPEGYDALVKDLRERDRLPTHIVHLWGITSDVPAADVETFDAVQQHGFYSLIFLAQALGEHEVRTPLHLGIVANHLYEVTGEEACCPHKATVWGPCKVIPQEYPHITCRSVDVVLPRPDSPRADATERAQDVRLADQIIAELLSHAPDQAVAYRGRNRWVRGFEPVRLEHAANGRGLREGGKYLITGATEEIGLLLAEHLIRSVNAKLTLIAPGSFPARDKWERWLGAHDDQDEVSRKIRRLRALEAEAVGGEILFISADVASASQMQAALDAARERFGEFNGVIHAANEPGAGLIQLKTAEMAAAVLEPKTKGALVLATLIKDWPLDFCALFSSSVAVAGGFGQVDACAANAFLDALANERARNGEAFTVAVDWSAFQWDQWQIPVAMGTPELQAQLQENLQQNGIAASESLAAFERILGDALPQVIVCPQDLNLIIAQTDAFTVASLLETMKSARSQQAHPRPALAVSYQPPRDEVEQAIAGVWQEAFGIAQIGVEDNFFDLAGNSLLAIQIVTRLRQAFAVELPLTSLFDAPTVAELARKIQELRFEHLEMEGMELLLSEIEGLSPDEAERQFAAEIEASEEGQPR